MSASIPPFHPDAKRSFDTAASALFSGLSPKPITIDDSQRFPIDAHVKQTISDADIVPDSLVQIQADHSGIEVARYFTAGDKPFALEGEQHAAFQPVESSRGSWRVHDCHASLPRCHTRAVRVGKGGHPNAL